MPVLKLNHLSNFYLLKVKKADADLMNDPNVQAAAGNLLVEMGVQPFNCNPNQNIIDVAIVTNASGEQELSLTASVPGEDAVASAPEEYATVSEAATLEDDVDYSLLNNGNLKQADDKSDSPARKKINLMSTPVKVNDLADCKNKLLQWSPFKNKQDGVINDQEDDDLGCYNLLDHEENPSKSFIKVEGLPNTPHFQSAFDHDFKDRVEMVFPQFFVRGITHSSEPPTAIVEMDCAEAVEAVLSLELDFEEKPLIMSKYCVPDAAKSTSPSAEVLLQGVPGPLLFEAYFMEILSAHVVQAMAQAGMNATTVIQPEVTQCYDKDTSSLTVKFPSVEIASEFCNHCLRVPFRFRGATVKCSQIFVPNQSIYKVLLEQVTLPFDKEILVLGIKDALMQSNCVSADTEFFINVGDYDIVNQSVIVEFDSADIARELCRLPFEYNYDAVKITSIDDSLKTTLSYTVEIGGIIPPYSSANLKKGIMKALQMLDDDPILTIGEFVNESVVIEVRTEQVADAICALSSNFKYNYKPLTFQKQMKGAVERQPKPQQPKQLAPSRDDWPYYESLQLLIECIKYREILPNYRNRQFSTAWEAIRKAMLEKNLNYTVDSMKKRLRGILQWYPKAGKKWPLRLHVMEYLGEKPPGSSQIPEQCLEQVPRGGAPTSAKSKSAYGVKLIDSGSPSEDDKEGWNYRSDMSLIREYKSRKTRFDDKKTRASELYAEISDSLGKEGFKDRTAEKCSDRMSYLAMTFKKKYDALRQTGTDDEPMKWTYYDAMSKLFEHTAVLEPQKILSFGSSFGEKSRAAPRKSNTPPSSQKERKAQIGEGLLKEFARFNKTYEDEVALKKSS